MYLKEQLLEKKIPFEISEGKTEITREGAIAAFNAIRGKAIEDGLSDMSLEEINEEINAAHKKSNL